MPRWRGRTPKVRHECGDDYHAFEIDKLEPEVRCLCGAYTWGEADRRLRETEMLERMFEGGGA